MRKSRLSQEEVAELDEINRQDTRNSGFNLMSTRDRGGTMLSNGVVVEWHVDRPLKEGEARTRIYPGDFIIDGKVYDSEELMKYLRWS